jgi:hypothetical protein
LQTARQGGPPTDPLVRDQPNNFTVFKESLINSNCSGCAQSDINEPEVANSGKTVLETSNWNIAYTLDGGAASIAWHNLNPYALSAGFCCDQQVVYNADRDVYLILQLDYAGEGNPNNGLALSASRGATPWSMCTYKFSGAIGGGATDTPDFPKISVSNNNVFLTWNDYPPHSPSSARSGLARMPLDAIASCAGFSYLYLTRSTEFTFALARTPTAKDQFYWVSNWMLDGTVNGSNLRIWPDNSGTYFWVTRGINPYTFGTVGCGSPNWCSRLDPRYEAVVISPGEYRAQANSAFAGEFLEVAATAGPSGFSGGKNYTVYNYFHLHSLNYIGSDQTYNPTIHFVYAGCAANEKGYVGCAMSYGLNSPGGFILLQDNVNPTQPWGYNYPVGAIGGASAWGDYIETSAWNPHGGPFQTVLWNVSANGAVQPYYLVWGRGSDNNEYLRWKDQ